jgi:hypothetical protein
MSIYATIELDESGHQDLPSELDPNNEGFVYGQNIGQCDGLDQLDGIATEGGVEPLSNYLDDSEMLSEEELEEMGLPPADENWNPIEDGLTTFQHLVTKLEKLPAGSLIGRYPVESILWDLRAYIAILNNAKSPDELFRLIVT